jgi:hypothetical protein
MNKELYFFPDGAIKHELVHSLQGVYVTVLPTEKIDAKGKGEAKSYYPLKLIFPTNKVRILFFDKKDKREDWETKLKSSTG